MAVEVLPSTIVDGGRPRIGVASSDLDITQGNSCVECRHNERGTEHVGVNDPEPGSLPDGPDPTVCSATVKSLSVVTVQDRSYAAFAEREVDGAGHSWDQGDHGRLVAFADNAQRPVSPVEAQVLGIGCAGLAHSQTIQAQQSGESGVVGVVTLSREEEPTELAPVETTSFARVDPGPAGILRRVRGDSAVDVGEAVEPADGGQPPVDGRSGQSPLLHGAAP
jgi:hypothetical protein